MAENNDRIVNMARKKRQYESTRIKLDMSFEEALAKLCQHFPHGETGNTKAIDTEETTAGPGKRVKKTD